MEKIDSLHDIKNEASLAIMKLQRELEELGTSYTQEIEASDRQAQALDELNDHFKKVVKLEPWK